MDTYLPPKYSLNSFFVRHVAHPRRMKHISGLNNAQICAVNDVGYIDYTSKIDPPNFPPNNFNQNLLKSDSFLAKSKRKEKAVPYNGPYSTFGLIDNTEKWRNELNTLASQVGLLTQNDLEHYKKKKEREQMIKLMKEQSRKPSSSSSSSTTKLEPLKMMNRQQTSSNSGNGNGTASRRLNEPVLKTRRTSRYSRGSTGAASRGILASSNKKYIVDQADREAWMLQVLCQILQTDNLVDVQAWLVSANDSEKEKIKQLIDQAMRGLEDSGRIEQHNQENNTLEYIENNLKNLDLNKLTKENLPTSSQGLYKERPKLPNILKLEDDDNNHRLEPILEDNKPSVININMQSPTKANLLLDNAIVKLETPRKDLKIEQVKVSMLVKDEKSNNLQEINGDWKPE